jgi:PDDEXK-like uncharacterized protein DUF3799
LKFSLTATVIDMPLPNFTDGSEGVIYDLPDAEYRAASGVSNSMLKAIALEGEEPGSPAHFVAQFNDPNTDTDALFFGRMIHSRILTPDEPLPGVVEIPETYTNEKAEVKPWSGNAKVCKSWLAARMAEGLRPMKAEEIQKIDGVVSAIANDTTCKIIFEEGKAEVSLFKQFHRDGGMVLRKARLDWVSPGAALVDIKSCQDARKFEFARVIWSRRYYCQFAYYIDLWNELNPQDQKTEFVVIAVEKFAPYNIAIYQIDHSDIEEGRREYKRNLALVMQCMSDGAWPGYSTDIQTIKMAVPYNRTSILRD